MIRQKISGWKGKRSEDGNKLKIDKEEYWLLDIFASPLVSHNHHKLAKEIIQALMRVTDNPKVQTIDRFQIV